jgi:hypothetical protein
LCSCWGFFNGTNLYEYDKGFYEDGKLILVLELEQDYLFAAVNEVCPEMPFAAQDPKLSKELGNASATLVTSTRVHHLISPLMEYHRMSSNEHITSDLVSSSKTISTLLQHGGLDETIYSR